MTSVIPDGEYDVAIGDFLLAQLRGLSRPSSPSTELFSLRFTERPEDESNAMELNREAGAFQLKHSRENEETTYSGELTEPTETECVLVFNDKLQSFELRRVTARLVAGAGVKRVKKTEKPVKRRKAETSIFAPKTRPLSPLATSAGAKRQTTPVYAEDSQSNKPLAPSPLAISPVRNSQPKSSLSRASTPLEQPQFASKKPPQIATPTVDEDEDFGALVDELEEELSSDGFIVEDSSKTTNTPSLSFDFDYNGKKPMSFRDLAGMADEEEDVTSSEEE